MSSVNTVFLLGHLGHDPEVHHTQSGRAVLTLRLATNERWTDREGAPQERAEWHSVVVFGRQAETCGAYLSKGRAVLVEGRLQTRTWEDATGSTRYATEVVAHRVQFLGSRDPEGAARVSDRATETFDEADIPF